MFEKVIPLIPREALVIMDVNETLITKKPYRMTDPEGFKQLYKHVKGNIVFLTGNSSKREIQQGFKDAGLRYCDYTVWYTKLPDVPKGIFLKEKTYPKHTVFIDNSVRQLNSVRKHCPDIMTFRVI